MNRAYNKTIKIKPVNGVGSVRVSSLLLMLLLGIFIVSNFALAAMYRWVDEAGKVHYSQSIPPSQSQLGHLQLNEKNGMTLNSVESSAIKKQRKKDEQLIIDEKIRNKKALREELMVYMFASKKELVSHFEKRLKMISVNIRLLKYHQKKLETSIETVNKRISRASKEKLKNKWKKNLQDSQSALIDHSRAIENNMRERTEVNEQLARAVKTYDKKFGTSELNVGSLIGDSVLSEFRGKTGLPSSLLPGLANNNKGMCSCPCTASQ